MEKTNGEKVLVIIRAGKSSPYIRTTKAREKNYFHKAMMETEILYQEKATFSVFLHEERSEIESYIG